MQNVLNFDTENKSEMLLTVIRTISRQYACSSIQDLVAHVAPVILITCYTDAHFKNFCQFSDICITQRFTYTIHSAFSAFRLAYSRLQAIKNTGSQCPEIRRFSL